jgi:hypothetical protein
MMWHLQDAVVFAYEAASSGQRGFLVATLEDFWRRYQCMRPEERHFYEVLREAEPCKLYLDVEYMRASNPGKDSHRMMALLQTVGVSSASQPVMLASELSATCPFPLVRRH